MSEDNIELLRRGHRAFTENDHTQLTEVVSDDVDWGTTGSFPGLEPRYTGPRALDRWIDTVRSAWESFSVELDEVVRDEDDLLVVVERLRGKGRESGAEVDMRIFAVYWFAGGRVVKRRVFTELDDAVAAAATGSDA